MAAFRSKSRPEIARFCRSLVERGYRQVPRVSKLVPLKQGEFRIYPERNKGKASGWFRVSYYEARKGPFMAVPEAKPARTKRGGLCSFNITHGKAHSRGLCANCYHRWQYWTKAELRERMRNRSAEVRRAA